jgi:hypothetical protein
MLYLEALKENRWQMVENTERDSSYWIKAYSPDQLGLELDIKTLGEKIEVRLVYGLTDYD